jgi:WD40 repeat protein
MNFTDAAPPGDPTYWQDIRPVLRKNCTVCHSAKNRKELDVSGGLALDSYDAVLKGGRRPVIQTGKSADSRLIKRVTADDDSRRMPQGADPLPAATIALLRRWIDSGAREGQQPVETTTLIAATGSRRTRKLDVVLPTNAVPPNGKVGPAKPGRLELDLKVGPLSPVAAVAFSPDGKLLATGSYRQVTVWDLASVRPVTVLTNLLGAVNDLRFSPDGKLLAVAGGQPSAKGDLRLYEVAGWKLAANLGGHLDVVFCVAFHPDGQHLASASFDKTVRLWDLSSHKLMRTFTHHSDFVYSVAFGPGGKWLVSSSKDRSVRMFDPATGKSVFTFSGMDQDVLAVAVSPDGKSVVSSGFESALHWWNPQTGERVRVQGGHGVAVHELCFSDDGKVLASAGGDGTVRVWNGSSGALLQTMSVGAMTYAVRLSPNAKVLASGSFDGLVRLWDTASGRQLAVFLSLPPQQERTDWLAVTPEGYVAGSAGLPALGQWRMAGQTVPFGPVWQALEKPDVVAKAVRGDKLPTLTWK